jgi:hypothetical protein
MGNPAGVRRDFDALERRRFQGLRLLRQGLNQSEVAVGRATNDPDLEAEGQVEKIGGKVQKKIGQVEKVLGK